MWTCVEGYGKYFMYAYISPHTSWNPVLKANTNPAYPGQNKRHTRGSLQVYTPVNVTPPPPQPGKGI